MNQLGRIQSLLSPERPAILLTGAANRQYATGARIDEGMCLITARGGTCFTDGRYLEAAQRTVSGFRVAEVDRNHNYVDQIKAILTAEGCCTLGIEEEELTHGAFTRYAAALGVPLVPCQQAVDALRYAKEPWEHERMRQAQAMADGVFSQLLGLIRPGMSEKELEAELIYRLYRAGAEGLSFPPIVVSGPNTSMPHGVAGARRLTVGDFVTMDFGVKLGGYCSDMTRTVALGHATDEMRQVYDIVLRAQRAGIAATRAGQTGRSVDAAAREVIERAGYGPCFSHSYGHSLGLAIHERPNCAPGDTRPLPAGAVVSAEPGIYLPGKFGVRIEDVVIIRPDGCENITRSPKELIIL